MDPVVGSAGDVSVFLSELSLYQLRRLCEKLGKTPDKKTGRRVLEREVVAVVERGGALPEFTVDAYVWCEMDRHRPKRVSFWCCRMRQTNRGTTAQATCRGKKCQHLLGDRKMAKEKKERALRKRDLLKAAFAKQKSWGVQELLDETGYELKTLQSTISTMKPDYSIVYDRKTKIFTLQD